MLKPALYLTPPPPLPHTYYNHPTYYMKSEQLSSSFNAFIMSYTDVYKTFSSQQSSLSNLFLGNFILFYFLWISSEQHKIKTARVNLSILRILFDTTNFIRDMLQLQIFTKLALYLFSDLTSCIISQLI